MVPSYIRQTSVDMPRSSVCAIVPVSTPVSSIPETTPTISNFGVPELSVLISNGTWSLVSLLDNRIIVGCKWIFKTKKNIDGSVAHHKVRLVAKGLVIKQPIIRVLLSLAFTNNWQLRQIDINNAFLKRDLHEEVYMDQPPGFEQCDERGVPLVCRLNKSIYGIKQAPRVWFKKPTLFLVGSLMFRASKADSSLFIKDWSILFMLTMSLSHVATCMTLIPSSQLCMSNSR
ncbi:Retrovirus-related Pol polyprotein from transposon TNT 1-94 [Gossypium australe]|uniref:Retrovirus-related Pol polyprotein from transposon TNT 1-94 n=1 Tax=Gossypium australe TaxID=47621 RepID=A0A5B6WJ45_9ROSI|nr:Retrovirus-related Pol polyprotein from transposon TNT 1-94 [Gossypium australe]